MTRIRRINAAKTISEYQQDPRHPRSTDFNQGGNLMRNNGLVPNLKVLMLAIESPDAVAVCRQLCRSRFPAVAFRAIQASISAG